MNVDELRAILGDEGVRRDGYSLNGGLPNEATCLEELPYGGWHVYYSERGKKSTLHVFENEDEACNFMLGQVREDERRRRDSRR